MFRKNGRTKKSPNPRFLVDGMLGSLSTKLRILGFDTLYDKESSDSELLEIARNSRRILLTSDHELCSRSRSTSVSCIELHASEEDGRLAELFHNLGIHKVESIRRSRCSSCNGKLAQKENDYLGRQIYECEDCGKRYWRGAHWEKLETLFEKVNASLSNMEPQKIVRCWIEMQQDQIRNRFSIAEGKIMISSVREAITNFLSTSKTLISSRLSADPRFDQKLGCFVTLNDASGNLRGCIGFAEPTFGISKALTHAAIAAATQDPRFPTVTLDELPKLFIEVSALTTPKVIEVASRRDLIKSINVGKDGLILRWNYGSGLLLPQVARENNWDAEEFLSNLSMKAGAPPDEWLVPGSVVLKFQAQVFRETSPDGPVVEE